MNINEIVNEYFVEVARCLSPDDKPETVEAVEDNMFFEFVEKYDVPASELIAEICSALEVKPTEKDFIFNVVQRCSNEVVATVIESNDVDGTSCYEIVELFGKACFLTNDGVDDYKNIEAVVAWIKKAL